jgi:hypothetical protein
MYLLFTKVSIIVTINKGTLIVMATVLYADDQWGDRTLARQSIARRNIGSMDWMIRTNFANRQVTDAHTFKSCELTTKKYIWKCRFAHFNLSLLMNSLLGHRPYGLHIRRTGHNPPRRPSAVRWVLTTTNAVRTNGLRCLLKTEELRIGHPSNDRPTLFNFRDRMPRALIARRLRSTRTCQ